VRRAGQADGNFFFVNADAEWSCRRLPNTRTVHKLPSCSQGALARRNIMKLSHIVKSTVALVLASTLAGCFDVKIDVAVLDTDKASAKISTTIAKDVVDIAEIKAGTSDFCDTNGEIIEQEDTVTCTETHEGSFAEVFDFGEEDGPQPSIEAVGPRQFKVSFPTGALKDEIGGQAGGDSAQALAMMKQLFEGHTFTLRVSGGKIVDTNMVIDETGNAAELTLPFLDLAAGKASVPDEAYAIVQLP
jgi:hypothetical protein